MEGQHWPNQSGKDAVRGPTKGFCFLNNPFDSSDYFVTFLNTLRGDEHLARLQLPRIDNRQETRALSAALHENKGLVHLTVSFPALNDGRTEFF
jgi:hypothetical protein